MSTIETLKKVFQALKLKLPALKIEGESSAALLISLKDKHVLRMIGYQDELKVVKHIEVMYFPNKEASIVMPVFNNLVSLINSNDSNAPFKPIDQLHFEFGMYLNAKTHDDIIEFLINNNEEEEEEN